MQIKKVNMEGAIKTVVSVYLKSSKGKENLEAKDFQTLVKKQLKNILTDTDSSEAVKQMRQELDSNQDGKVNFQEYMTLVGYLAQSVSQQRCTEKETQAASSVPETQAEAPAAAKAEPEAEKEAEAGEAAKVKDEAEKEDGEKAEEAEETS
ncbi:hypothetical protein NFI96_034659 [Prochilodus magdalenae]|nr:hypothetical protein NFI96_034659 [Prochilodus magdalenae]